MKDYHKKLLENFAVCLTACVLVFGMASCENLRNLDTTKVKESASHVFEEVCAEKNTVLRQALLAKVQAQWPQFPVYDICSLVNNTPI